MIEKENIRESRLIPYPYGIANLITLEYGNDVSFTARDTERMIFDILTDREREVIELRWQDGLTLKEAGDLCHVTSERIRAIENRALNKLVYPPNFKPYTAVPYGKWEEESAARAKAEERLDLCLRRQSNETPSGTDNALFDPKNIFIEDLQDCISYHAAKCLKLAGYVTLNDLLEIPALADLERIKGLGRKSIHAILSYIHGRDLRMAWETNPKYR